jgi:Ca2+-dependent lipid-binding protein
LNGEGFKKRNELQGKQEYYIDVSLNGRPVKRTAAVKTMENPQWREKVSVMVKSPTDKITMKLFEENNLLKDSGEGTITVPLRQAIEEPGKPLVYSMPLKAKKSPEDPEGEKLKYEITYHPIGTLAIPSEQATPEKTMVENGAISEPSNSGILELRTITLVGLADKVAGRMKLSCQMGLSTNVTSNADLVGTKTVRAQGTDNRFTWELFQENFVTDYTRTSLWMVFTDESGLMADNRVASISIPVSLLRTGKPFTIPKMPALSVAVEGQYRGLAATLQAPVDKSGLLKMDIIRATVIAADSGGTSDPFVTVRLNTKTIFKTKVIKKTVTPEWKESCEIRLDDRTTSKLQFEVSDWNQVMMASSLA